MLHPSPLGQRFQGREREAVNLRVRLSKEVIVQNNFHMFDTHWPPHHSHFSSDVVKKLHIRTAPPPQNMVIQGILRPPIIAHLGQSEVFTIILVPVGFNFPFELSMIIKDFIGVLGF